MGHYFCHEGDFIYLHEDIQCKVGTDKDHFIEDNIIVLKQIFNKENVGERKGGGHLNFAVFYYFVAGLLQPALEGLVPQTVACSLPVSFAFNMCKL